VRTVFLRGAGAWLATPEPGDGGAPALAPPIEAAAPIVLAACDARRALGTLELHVDWHARVAGVGARWTIAPPSAEALRLLVAYARLDLGVGRLETRLVGGAAWADALGEAGFVQRAESYILDLR
jgi:hypothetical protein